jgi:hypothetical protein
MQSESKFDSPGIWFPIAMAGMALDLWILITLMIWRVEAGRPLPLPGFIMAFLNVLILGVFLYQILTGLFRPLQIRSVG